MPGVRSVSIEPDRVTITTHRGTRTYTRDDIPNQVLRKTLPEIEDAANTWLAAQPEFADVQIRVHIFAVDPQLIWTYLITDPGEPIAEDWWVGVED